MTRIDALFPVFGNTLPTDHGYLLFAALSRRIKTLHDGSLSASIAPLRARSLGRGLLDLSTPSELRVRLPAEKLPEILILAGASLDVREHRIRLGVPRVVALEPAPAVTARLLVIKPHMESETFLPAARRKLEELGVSGEIALTAFDRGPRTGEPRRRVVRIRGKAVVGYGVIVTQLSAEHSILLQTHGLGGRRKMGCGFFLPVSEMP